MANILYSLKTMLALKLRLRLEEITDELTIEKLSGGNSARRNEILADISAEFGIGAIDDAHNKPVSELSSIIQSRTRYASVGPYLGKTIDAAIKEKLPVSRARIVEYAAKDWSLGEDDVSSILISVPAAIRDGDSSKSGRLSDIGVGGRISSEDEAFEWLDRLISSKGFERKKDEGARSGVDAEALELLKSDLSSVGRQMLKVCGIDTLQRVLKDETIQKRVGFDEGKHVSFVSNWNWAKRDLIRWYHDKDRKKGERAKNEELEKFKRNANGSLLATARYFASKDASFEDVARLIEEGMDKNGRMSGRVALVTGAGPSSIAGEVVKLLLSEGAKVVVSTSNYSYDRVRYFRKLYQESCSNGSELHLLPADQGSFEDVEKLVRWTSSKLGSPDHLFPFGAVKQLGFLVDSEPSRSSKTLDVLLHGVEWLVSEAAKAAKENGSKCTCIIPLSPNHGQMGGDGSYAEAKLALEAILHKASSEYETFGRYVNVIGCRIGWTRGTGLMGANDLVADELERRYGVRTYSAKEMAGLLVEQLYDDAVSPRVVELTGGFERLTDIGKVMSDIKKGLKIEQTKMTDPEDRKLDPNMYAFPKGINGFRSRFRDRSLLDPSKVCVVVGYGEVSPYGNARSRFDIERNGKLTVSSAFELAFFMGLVRYSNDDRYVGWVDAKTGEPVNECALVERYGRYILDNTGIRAVDVESAGFDPKEMIVYTDVLLEDDILFPISSKEEAEGYDDVVKDAASGRHFIRFKKGSTIKTPRTAKHSRWISGQVPKGFDPRTFGISKELAFQVDRLSMFNFAASAEAFLSAGLTPEELRDKIHPSKIGNSQGSGIGGMTALTRLYHDWREDRTRKGDTLQETLINTIPAWLTQTFTGGEGPAVHPVGACATAVVSLSTACDLIQNGRAEFVVAGGYDDINPEGAIGFADMGATAPTDEMLAKGIDVKAISRPNDSRRGGFVEAQGGGTMLVATLERAISMGLPIYAVLAYTATHSDGYHSSIPAPGLGLLSMARGNGDSELARALAMFGLTADDITVVSKHDTSTLVNDPNENELHDKLQKALGRTAGNPLLVHSQKAVLGHSKGGAGAWAANAAVQMIGTGAVPGNPNLDDVDQKMSSFDTMCFTDETIELGEGNINAVMVTSLGFGHVGAAALFVHPRYALSSVPKAERNVYQEKLARRERDRMRREWMAKMGKEPAFRVFS